MKFHVGLSAGGVGRHQAGGDVLQEAVPDWSVLGLIEAVEDIPVKQWGTGLEVGDGFIVTCI